MKLFFKMIMFAVCFLILGGGINYCLVDNSSSYTRITLHEMYTMKDNIDVLFLGTSHCQRGFDPEIADTEFGATTFNLGSSSQKIEASYYLLKEVAKRNHLSKVFIELFCYETPNIPETRRELTSTYIITDYMKPSGNKIEYILKSSLPGYYVNSLVPARRYWNDFFNIEYITNNIKKKRQPSYARYDYVNNGDEWYQGLGFVYSDKTATPVFGNPVVPFNAVSENTLPEETKQFIIKIIEFCQNNEIELAFYETPMSDYMLEGIGNYDLFGSMVNEFLENYGLKYYDFNLCREQYFFIEPGERTDDNHLNGKGAEKFTRFFSRYFKGQYKDENIFYRNFKEKREAHRDEIWGITVVPQTNGTYQITALTGVTDRNIEFKIIGYKETGEVIVIQEFNTNSLVIVEPDIVRLSISSKLSETELIVSVNYNVKEQAN